MGGHTEPFSPWLRQCVTQFSGMLSSMAPKHAVLTLSFLTWDHFQCRARLQPDDANETTNLTLQGTWSNLSSRYVMTLA